MPRAGALSANIIDFCSWLRSEFHFCVGHAEARDALRAVELVGIADPRRFRSALRLTVCTKPEELDIFESAFDAFFLHPERGARQSMYAPRHTRGRARERSDDSAQQGGERLTGAQAATQTDAQGTGTAGELQAVDESPSDTAGWEALRARYSPQAGAAAPPRIDATAVRERLAEASRLVSSVRLGRLRRWKPHPVGPRFDMRRTLRASLRTGGDLVALRFLRNPLRNPRFVLLIDGSRSMSAHGALMLEFAYALAQRSRRTHVFLFSTQLREVTLQLRKAARHQEHRLSDVGEAWGGGTRIGTSLAEFVHVFGARCLSDETVTIIYSDGLDVGDVRQLERAMREIHRRSAGVIWVNPLEGTPGYTPTARGMQASLPYVDAFVGARDAAELAGLARHAAMATR